MLGNPAFPNPPIDLAVLKASLDRFKSLAADATYGDSRVIIERDQLRSEIHVMLRHVAHYVEDNWSNDEMDKFITSGFDPMPSSRASKPMRDSRITSIDHPKTGGLHVDYTTAGRQARHYEIRSAPKGTPDPDSWPIRLFPNAKDGALYINLTPGVVYTFQVRVFGSSGHTDWSPAVDKMCT